mmetsp:Transcript_2926/g.9126  ORF Transcript_2926/g.9126 Transcript_2926/m.9126 type:complete len:202 (-) Transcript_2926:177-782(-)
MLGTKPSGGWYPWHSTKLSMDALRDDFGFTTVTSRKKSCSFAQRNGVFGPRKILATNVPPGARTNVEMFCAARSSWCCTYSSSSWRPVTSGAPSHTTSWALQPRRLMILSAVAVVVMSPWKMRTPGIGAMSWRSTATMRHSSSARAAVASASSAAAALALARFSGRRVASTWLHDPGAAQRSTARVTPSKMWKLSSICKSL